MASLSGKVETDVELKASAEKVYGMLLQKPPQADSSASFQVQSCDCVEGDWGKAGAIICWNYSFAGEPKVLKEKIEAVDVDKKSMTLKVIDGDLLKEYKSLVVSIQANPKSGGDGCVVHWTVEYEKLHEGAVPPEALLQFGIQICKDADAYLA